MSSLEDIAWAINGAERILICGHIMPDGDSLGSVLALGAALEQLGKQVVMAGPDPVPLIYQFLPNWEKFRTGEPPENNFDTLVALDCSVPGRLGSGYCDLPAQDHLTVINIDHHAGSSSFGRYRYIDPKAAAVGEIIFDLLELMGVDINLETAICLYTAIATDTGSFQYESTSPVTHRRVARLLETGVPVAQINVSLYEEKTRASYYLLGAALNTLSFSAGGNVAWMTVTHENILDLAAKDEHTEGLVNYARGVRGVEVGLLFHELADGRIKISFRSKSEVDVRRLAALFGGGGHSRAAGCEVAGDLKKIQAEVVAAAVAAAGEQAQ